MKTETLEQMVLHKDIRPDPQQPRRDFPAAAQAELKESIRVNGITDRLIVRPDPGRNSTPHPGPLPGRGGEGAKYMIVEGERRWRVAQELKIERVPVEVREMTDDQARKYQRIVGTQRLNLSLLEQAQDFLNELVRRRAEKPQFSVEDCADALGMKRATAYERYKLTRLHPPVRNALTDGTISASVAGAIAVIPDPKAQAECLKTVTNENDHRYPFSVRGVQELIDRDYVRNLNEASFDKKATVKGAPHPGPCAGCPFRSWNMAAEFPDIKNPNVCTNAECFTFKTQAHTDAVLSQAKTAGSRILSQKEYADKRHNYQTMDDKCWEDGRNRTFGQLAKAAKIAPIVTVDRKGVAVEVFAASDVEKIKAANKIKERSGNSYAARDNAAMKKRQQKEKLLDATLAAAIPGILDKLLRKGVPDARLWPLLAEAAYHALNIDQHDFMAKRLGISQKVNDSGEALQKYIGTNNAPQESARIVVELLLLSTANGGGWHEVKWNKSVLATAKLARVNLEKLAAKMAAAKEKAKPSGRADKPVIKSKKGK